MRFKKIYIEITNGCNLNCSFCIGNRRKVKFLTFDEFKYILDIIKPYTNYLYFHVLGEPLLHPFINQFIDYAASLGFNINITTNGYLINKIKDNKNIRQLNISLHSYNQSYGIDLNDYLDNIFSSIANFNNTYISLRLWLSSVDSDAIISYIMKKYNLDSLPKNFNNFKLSNNVFLSQFHEFIWPDLNNDYYFLKGKCYGLIDHIGILSDGSVVPCCLDSMASICLGNIFNDNLEHILESDRVINMIRGFKCNKKCEELCRHCNFLKEN